MDSIICTMDAKVVCCVGASIKALSGGSSIDLDGLGGGECEEVNMDVT